MKRFDRVRAWFLRFFAEPVDGTSAALFRVCLGVLACWESVGVWLNVERYFSPQAMTPYSLVARDKFIWLTPFAWFHDSTPLPFVLAAL